MKRSYISIAFESSVTACIGAATGLMLSRWIIPSDKDGYYASIFSMTGAILYGAGPFIDYGMKRLDDYIGQDGSMPDIDSL
jgi:hypothetical protein